MWYWQSGQIIILVNNGTSDLVKIVLDKAFVVMEGKVQMVDGE